VETSPAAQNAEQLPVAVQRAAPDNLGGMPPKQRNAAHSPAGKHETPESPSKVTYVMEAASIYGIKKKVQFKHRISSVEWSSHALIIHAQEVF
jgi:hypothetical protein